MTEQRWVSELRSAFWLRGEPDPRLLQLGFAAILVGVALVGQWIRGWPAGLSPMIVATTLAVVGFVLTVVITPRTRDLGRLLRALAFFDLGVIGISSLQLHPGTLALVVLPALWLGRQMRWRAVPVSGIATVVLVTIPASLRHGTSHDAVLQVVTLPFVAMLAVVAIAVGLDIAARMRAEAEQALAELAAERRNADAIVSAVDVGLVLLDRDGNVEKLNVRQREIERLKYPSGRGNGVTSVFGADATTPLPTTDLPSALAARGEDFDDQRIWVGADPPSRRALSVSARAVLDEAGQRVGSALAYKDVTDLVQAMKARDEFVSLVSHELRTPLTAIYGYSTMLLERDDLPDGAAKQLQVVLRSTDRLRLLVDDLLQTAQLANGELRIELALVDLAVLVRDAVSAAEPEAEAAAVDVRREVPATLEVVGDAFRLAQVVDNLLSNAIKYTPPGGQVLVAVDESASTVRLRVRDSGIGIAADDLGKVFARFFRTPEVAERSIKGLGLGLAIVQAIVDGHGGTVEIDSEPGVGSEFRVLLPRHRPEPDTP